MVLVVVVKVGTLDRLSDGPTRQIDLAVVMVVLGWHSVIVHTVLLRAVGNGRSLGLTSKHRSGRRGGREREGESVCV